MSILEQVTELMVRFEVAHNCAPNIIVLGPDNWTDFQDVVNDCFFQGARVLRTNSPGVWVGRVIEPTK